MFAIVVNKTRRLGYYRDCGFLFKPDDVVFGTKRKAKWLVSELQKIIDRYGCALVQDYENLIDFNNIVYITKVDEYGWTDTDGFEIIKTYDGYRVRVPSPRRVW